MARATHQDATLLVQLAQWQTHCRLSTALSRLQIDGPSEGQDLDGSGEETAALICSYFETVGALHHHGLLHEDLLFDWMDAAAVWDRLKPFVLARRRAAGMPALWSGFEGLATAQKRKRGAYST